jgi:hypothetical protein
MWLSSKTRRRGDMSNDIARTISTIAIWAAVGGVLTNLKINGTAEAVVTIFVGMTAFLSIGAAASTWAIWKSPRPTDLPKTIEKEI